jgi:transcriptional regulator with XRE-family HTH domain
LITKEITRDNLSKILICFISDKKITQAEIAKKSGVDKNTISSLVNGSKPQAITAHKLKEYFMSIGYYVEKK